MSFDDVLEKQLPANPLLARKHVEVTAKHVLKLYDLHVLEGYDKAEDACSGLSNVLPGEDFDLEYVILDLVSSQNPDLERMAHCMIYAPETFGSEALPLAYIARRGFVNALEGSIDGGFDRDKCLLGSYCLLTEMIKRKIQK